FRFSWEAISGSRNGYISFRQNLSAIEAFPADLINILIISLSVLMFYDFLKRRQFMKSLFGALTVLVTFGYFISMKGIPPIIPAIFMNIFLFILSITRIIMGARNNKLDLLNTGMLMLAVLILARFFDSDIGFIAKGLAFILIGLGFLLTNIKMISRSRGQK
ncbi:MAG TPA: hypothetical protein PLU24_03075, partial [Candidatus Omnitrophota bacterium]|nr:hypothetical protein [Candidatus Omnitrophota bacterium]